MTLLAVGDSIIDGTGCSSLAHAVVGQTAHQCALQTGSDVSWQVIAQSGLKTREVCELLQNENPSGGDDLVLISVGVNDVTGLRRLSSWQHDLAALLTSLRELSPQALIAVIGLPPMGKFPLLPQPLRALFGLRAKSFELGALQTLAQFDNAIYLPVPSMVSADQFAEDGYHPGDLGCQALGVEFAAQITTKLNS